MTFALLSITRLAAARGASYPQKRMSAAPPTVALGNPPPPTASSPANPTSPEVALRPHAKAAPAKALPELPVLRAFANTTVDLQALGAGLVDSHGRPAPEALDKNKYTLVYFGEPWCPGCRSFAPELVEFYERAKKTGNFQTVLFSRGTASATQQFMHEEEMPWPALSEQATTQLDLDSRLGVSAIPCAVLLDAHGRVVSHSIPGGEYKGPGAVVNDLEWAQTPQTPAAVMERRFRGGEGSAPADARPIGFGDVQRIVRMDESRWKPEDLIAYYKRHKTPKQRGILVMVKTELCCDNGYRGCAVATSVLEKTHPELMVFMAWVKNEAALEHGQDQARKAAWDQRVIDAYGFVQGPGARLVFLDPRSGAQIGTDAQEMKLYQSAFAEHRGTTPTFDRFAERALRRIAAGQLRRTSTFRLETRALGPMARKPRRHQGRA